MPEITTWTRYAARGGPRGSPDRGPATGAVADGAQEYPRIGHALGDGSSKAQVSNHCTIRSVRQNTMWSLEVGARSFRPEPGNTKGIVTDALRAAPSRGPRSQRRSQAPSRFKKSSAGRNFERRRTASSSARSPAMRAARTILPQNLVGEPGRETSTPARPSASTTRKP